MIAKTVVGDVMTTQLRTVAPDASLNEAVDLLLRHSISGLPVVDEAGRLVGILTEQDCLRSAYQSDYYQDRDRAVAKAMTPDVLTIDAEADIMTAMSLFLDRSFRRLPVLSEGRLVGLVSRRDVLRALRVPR